MNYCFIVRVDQDSGLVHLILDERVEGVIVAVASAEGNYYEVDFQDQATGKHVAIRVTR